MWSIGSGRSQVLQTYLLLRIRTVLWNVTAEKLPVLGPKMADFFARESGVFSEIVEVHTMSHCGTSKELDLVISGKKSSLCSNNFQHHTIFMVTHVRHIFIATHSARS